MYLYMNLNRLISSLLISISPIIYISGFELDHRDKSSCMPTNTYLKFVVMSHHYTTLVTKSPYLFMETPLANSSDTIYGKIQREGDRKLQVKVIRSHYRGFHVIYQMI